MYQIMGFTGYGNDPYGSCTRVWKLANDWLSENDGKIEVISISQSEASRDSHFSVSILYKKKN